MMRPLIEVGGALALVLATGCSLLLDADDQQCSSAADCEKRGFSNATCEDNVCVMNAASSETQGSSSGTATSTGAGAETSSSGTDETAGSSTTTGIGDGPWDCVGNVVWDEEDEGIPARVGLHFTDSQFADLEGATLNACRPLDLECTEPYSTTMSDENGVAFADVYYGFDGYFRAPPPDDIPDAYPFIVYAYPPPFSEETESRGGDILFINPATLGALAGVTGVDVVPDTGFVFFTVFDCNDQLAADVTVSVSPVGSETVVAYLDGAFPNPDLGETTEVGQGAVLNVPPGLVEVTATSLERGRFFQASVLVEPNTVTGVALVPSPM